MPQNKTRLWVGLGIAVITIPAVGTFYSHAAVPSDLVGNPISAAGRIDLASRQQDSLGSGQTALREPLRNYQAEVNAALVRQGFYPGQRFDGDTTDDATFDDDPLDADTDAYGNVTTRDVPNPSALPVPGSPNLVAYSTDGPVTADPQAQAASKNAMTNGVANGGQMADNGPTTDNSNATPDAQGANGDANAIFDDYGQGGTMSDSDVYRLVVNNLSQERRDDFTRAYSAMSQEQRAGLLDSFRQQIQGGQ